MSAIRMTGRGPWPATKAGSGAHDLMVQRPGAERVRGRCRAVLGPRSLGPGCGASSPSSATWEPNNLGQVTPAPPLPRPPGLLSLIQASEVTIALTWQGCPVGGKHLDVAWQSRGGRGAKGNTGNIGPVSYFKTSIVFGSLSIFLHLIFRRPLRQNIMSLDDGAFWRPLNFCT